jgi:hypothetical protein
MASRDCKQSQAGAGQVPRCDAFTSTSPGPWTQHSPQSGSENIDTVTLSLAAQQASSYVRKIDPTRYVMLLPLFWYHRPFLLPLSTNIALTRMPSSISPVLSLLPISCLLPRFPKALSSPCSGGCQDGQGKGRCYPSLSVLTVMSSSLLSHIGFVACLFRTSIQYKP